MVAFGWFVLGLVLLVVGAELVVRGGSRFAQQIGIPPLVVGITIVAVGTSSPELAIGIVSALEGTGSLTVGNITGANIANLLLLFGLSALLKPLTLHRQTLRFDLPVLIGAGAGLMAAAWDGLMTRAEGAILVGAAMLYTAAIVRWTLREGQATRAEKALEQLAPAGDATPGGPLRSLAMLLAGVTLIVAGSEWLVDGAVEIATRLGVSSAFIGLTIVALGTTSPELATTIVSTIRNTRDLAVGNLLGSSIYNVLLILGVTCLVPRSGIEVEADLVRADIPVMVAVALACFPVFWSGRRISRLEGGLFVGAYAGYLTYLVVFRA